MDNESFNKKELEKKKKSEILAIAKTLNIKGRSLLKKDQLIKKIIVAQVIKNESIDLPIEKNKKTLLQSTKTVIKKTDLIKTKKDRIEKNIKKKTAKKIVDMPIEIALDPNEPIKASGPQSPVKSKSKILNFLNRHLFHRNPK